jgi:DNA-binding response regulator regX3
MGVLIVDDEAELADAIATYLKAFGFDAEYVVDGASALAAFDACPPKLVVLDVNLPDVNGFEVCRAMRAKSDVPILFLSARGSDDDQILALGLGGDDYVRKPVSLAVLLAKVRRMLDRLGQPRGFRDDWLVVDDDADRVFVDGAEIKLTAMEHRLLRHLVANRGRVVPKEELFTAVWDSPLTGDATLSVHVRRLRTHIEPDPADPRYVKTVWGRGYVFEGGR